MKFIVKNAGNHMKHNAFLCVSLSIHYFNFILNKILLKLWFILFIPLTHVQLTPCIRTAFFF